MLHPDTTHLYSIDTLNQVIHWAHQAGQIALRYFRYVTFDCKPDQSFLTQADLEIEHFLVEQIRTAYPEHSLISEEGARTDDTLPADYVWVIDPLDGTTAFVQGLPGWGIAMGLLHQGQPCFGLFYMPLFNDLTYTAGPGKLYDGNGRDLSGALRRGWDQKGFLALTASAHHDFEIDVRRTRTLGSASASLVYTARGVAAATFLPRPRLWDLVAGAAMLNQAGGELRYLSGQSINYLDLLDGRAAPEPVIAGSKQLLAELQTAIQLRHQPI